MTPQTDLPLVTGHRGALPGADICLLRDESLITTRNSQLRDWIQRYSAQNTVRHQGPPRYHNRIGDGAEQWPADDDGRSGYGRGA